MWQWCEGIEETREFILASTSSLYKQGALKLPFDAYAVSPWATTQPVGYPSYQGGQEMSLSWEIICPVKISITVR